MKKITILLACICTVFLMAFTAQSQAQTTLKVRVIDTLTKEPIEFATFSIKYIGEQTAKRYALTDSTGVAKIANAAVGRATVAIECVGYLPYNGVFDVHRGVNDMGTIALDGRNMLNAVTVTAAGNQILVKRDTIEYNANSFKTNETDMLEELLKKLPGVEIDSDGTITANGKTINKIMIDGKTFFLDDPQLASKNLPAKIVEKVKVVERKSDEARFTGIDDGEEETVLDLSLKPGMANGWIGNIGGGYGSKHRYEGAAMVGRFTKNLQISFIGNANNTNNRGFNDMAGSMMSVMMSAGGGGMGRGVGGGFSFTGNGITASKMLGTNVNYQTDDKKWKINSSYMYSTTNKHVEEETNTTTMLSETLNQFSWNDGNQKTVSHGHRFNAEIEYSPTDATSFIFRPYIRIGNGDFRQNATFYTKRGLEEEEAAFINDGNRSSTGDNNSQQIGGRLLWRQRLWKPGRTLTLRVNYAFSNNKVDGFNYSATNYYTDGALSSEKIIDQKYNQVQRSNQFGVNFTYTEPLGKNYFVQGSYRYSLNHSNTSKMTYDKNATTQQYTDLDEDYSSKYASNFVTQRYEIALRKQEDKYNFMFGISATPASTKTEGRSPRDTSYTVTNFAPSARLDYRISETEYFRIYYWGNTTQPSLNQLLPIPDNSNPLVIQSGNDKLKPSFSHRIGGEYRTNNRQTMSWFGTFFDFTYTKDAIINKKAYREDGVQENTYVNVDKGTYSANVRLMYNSTIAKSPFSFNIFTNFRFNNGYSYVNSSGTFVENNTKSLNASFNGRLTYRIDNFEATVGGGTNYNNSWYSVKSIEKVSTWSSRVSASINWTFLQTFNVTTDVNHRFYHGYSAGYGKSQTIWNGEISKTFYHNAFTFKVRVYDILNKSRNKYRTTSENYIREVSNNTLGRYVMFSLTFRFGSFGGKNMRDASGRGGFMGPPMGGGPGGGRGRR